MALGGNMVVTNMGSYGCTRIVKHIADVPYRIPNPAVLVYADKL